MGGLQLGLYRGFHKQGDSNMDTKYYDPHFGDPKRNPDF